MKRLLFKAGLVLAAALLAPTVTNASTVDFDNAQGNAALYVYQGSVDIQGLTFSYPAY